MGNSEQQVLQNNNDTSGGCNNNNNNNVSINKPSQGRYCHIVKRPDFDGYGFNLHSEKVKPGQYIGKVDANSPAEAAGLREGDQIIEVNGVNIGSETHKQVVQRIKAIANEVRLLLLDPNEKTTANSKSNNNNITASPKSQNKVKAQPNSPTTASAIETIAVGVPVAVPVPAPVIPDDATVEQKEYITSIIMVSTTKAQTQSSIDTTDHATAPVNGHNIKSNGNAMESIPSNQAAVTAPSEPAEPVQRPNNNGTTQMTAATTPPPAADVPTASAATETGKPKTGLNLNLTAAEMRAKLLAKKKYDPKNESVDLKKKFEIIQKL